MSDATRRWCEEVREKAGEAAWGVLMAPPDIAALVADVVSAAKWVEEMPDDATDAEREQRLVALGVASLKLDAALEKRD